MFLLIDYQPEVEKIICAAIKTMEENGSDHIIAALRQCEEKIFGKGGAAELLSLHASTLSSRIKKLGIEKETVFRNSK